MRWEWKLFFSNEKFQGRNPYSKKLENKKRPHLIFLRLEADFFLALKPSLQCHLTFVKVGFPDNMTGLWAFEGQMPYQKYQGSPIVVRWETNEYSMDSKKWPNVHLLIKDWPKESVCPHSNLHVIIWCLTFLNKCIRHKVFSTNGTVWTTKSVIFLVNL